MRRATLETTQFDIAPLMKLRAFGAKALRRQTQSSAKPYVRRGTWHSAAKEPTWAQSAHLSVLTLTSRVMVLLAARKSKWERSPQRLEYIVFN
jgi:hypothetical protein